jgi:hypothetical protein
VEVRVEVDLVGLEMVVEVKVGEVRVAVGTGEEREMAGKGRVVGKGMGEGMVVACKHVWCATANQQWPFCQKFWLQ